MIEEDENITPINTNYKFPCIRIDKETLDLFNEVRAGIPISRPNLVRMAIKHYCGGVLNGSIKIDMFTFKREIGAYVSKNATTGGKRKQTRNI